MYPLLQIALLTAAWTLPAVAAPGAVPGIVLEEFVYRNGPIPSVHSATIVELPTGELLSAFFGGSSEGAADVEIWLSRKAKGNAWTAPISIANGVMANGARVATWNPVLFQARGGELMLFYKVGPNPAEWQGVVKTSADGGHTWSDARELGSGILGPVKNKPLELDDGTIVSGSSTEHDGWQVHVERSTDGGKSWTLVGPLKSSSGIAAIQPTLMTYPDGRIQMFCRTQSGHGFIASSWSNDGGLTWSPLQRATLPNNNSGLDAVSLADGRQLLVYNHSTRTEPGTGHKGRGILNVALSRDSATWDAALTLDFLDAPGKQFSYPAVIQTHDGLVHIVYTWHRQGIKHVVLEPTMLETAPMPNGRWPTRRGSGDRDMELNNDQ